MQILQTLWQLVTVLGRLIVEVGGLALAWSLLLAWVAWWLWGVNWSKVWPVLAKGGWAPAVLLVLVSALVWSQIAPSDCGCLQFVTVPNFWWQLGGVALLGATALFCGWLQGVFGWAPPELNLHPGVSTHHVHEPEHGYSHGPEHRHVEEEVHGHGHGHH